VGHSSVIQQSLAWWTGEFLGLFVQATTCVIICQAWAAFMQVILANIASVAECGQMLFEAKLPETFLVAVPVRLTPVEVSSSRVSAYNATALELRIIALHPSGFMCACAWCLSMHACRQSCMRTCKCVPSNSGICTLPSFTATPLG